MAKEKGNEPVDRPRTCIAREVQRLTQNSRPGRRVVICGRNKIYSVTNVELRTIDGEIVVAILAGEAWEVESVTKSAPGEDDAGGTDVRGGARRSKKVDLES